MRRYLSAAALSVALCLTTACSVSQQQEIEMGQQYAQQINSQLPIITDPEINRYVNVLGDSIAQLTSRGELEWHFYVVDSPEVNAFAVPGGFIYVNRGLIERTDKMDELAGVLGHEIGHVVRRHSVKQMEQQQGASLGVTLACVLTRVCQSQAAGTAINVAGSAVFAKFSRQDEAEADVEGIKNVVRAGIDPNGIPEMFEILLQERQQRPDAVSAWFATHPLEEDRIAATRQQIAAYDPAVIRSLSKDSQNFHRFKQRVQSLPPSPQPKQQGR
ncbi:MAG: M48 family metallopeptidase [Gemmatimonadaceae bacterium]